MRYLNLAVFLASLLIATTPRTAQAEGECGPYPVEFVGTLGCPPGSGEVFVCVHISGSAWTWAGSCRPQE